MLLLQTSIRTLLRVTRNYQLISKRFKAKRNKHSSRLKKDPTELAMEHFDTFYEPVFGEKWPSIRLALLSQQKYCALVNNFANSADTVANLVSGGADNLLKIAKETQPWRSPQEIESKQVRKMSVTSECENVSEEGEDISGTDLYTFMPTKKMGSEIELLKEREREMAIMPNIELNTTVIPDTDLHLPEYLKVYAYERGNASLFQSPKQDKTQKTDYYLYDAASILPVLALDLFPDCTVLDLCAAPGGKTLTMLQTHLTGNITCVDVSPSRLQRLSDIMAQYIPGKKAVGQLVKIVCSDGVIFCRKKQKASYDRVLVDVPCNSDRHVLEEPDNNLFKPGRLRERIQLPQIQTDLLYYGVLVCKPQGVIVYSTCTLSPVQNDGVVQVTLERIWTETKIELAVVDISHMAGKFRDIYNFANNTRFGQLVIPNVTANFGPMYICKLKRLN